MSALFFVSSSFLRLFLNNKKFPPKIDSLSKTPWYLPEQRKRINRKSAQKIAFGKKISGAFFEDTVFSFEILNFFQGTNYIFSPDEGHNAFGNYFLINSFYDSFLQQRKELNKASFQLRTRKTERFKGKLLTRRVL